MILSLILSLWIAARLTRQLRGLRDSALEMANIRLPEVVRRLRAGEEVDVAGQVPSLQPSPDEIGQVKAAFNTAQRTAVEAAVDEAKVRRGINDVFRNLARRSQALLERQVTLLDSLERRAAEPEDLESLFRIDHLTTRMRRHAESLIVLAGDSPNRAFRDAVPFVDVLRAAAAEVEDYTRVRVVCRTPAALASPAVADVIHMLAEFVENATIFSPPNTEVRVTGELVAKGFAVDIEDRGLGMDDDEFADVNASLANPPLFDPSGSDRFGLFVAAQLARRHGIRAKLRRSDYGGVTAIVLIPLSLVVPANALGDGRTSGRGTNGRLTTASRQVTAPPVAGLPPVTAAPPQRGSARRAPRERGPAARVPRERGPAGRIPRERRPARHVPGQREPARGTAGQRGPARRAVRPRVPARGAVRPRGPAHHAGRVGARRGQPRSGGPASPPHAESHAEQRSARARQRPGRRAALVPGGHGPGRGASAWLAIRPDRERAAAADPPDEPGAAAAGAGRSAVLCQRGGELTLAGDGPRRDVRLPARLAARTFRRRQLPRPAH